MPDIDLSPIPRRLVTPAEKFFFWLAMVCTAIALVIAFFSFKLGCGEVGSICASLHLDGDASFRIPGVAAVAIMAMQLAHARALKGYPKLAISAIFFGLLLSVGFYGVLLASASVRLSSRFLAFLFPTL